MKKISITKYFLIILFLPFSILSQSNDLNQSEVPKYELEDHRLHIKGKCFNSSGKVHNVRIRIVHDDGVIDTLLSSNGKYNLHLEMNHKILIEFECLDNSLKLVKIEKKLVIDHPGGPKKLGTKMAPAFATNVRQ